jgi:hypothetical protein
VTLPKFIEAKLDAYTESIKTGSARADEHALGELTFYMALRRVLAGTATPQDLGMMDAINDVLQFKGVVKKGASFLK